MAENLFGALKLGKASDHVASGAAVIGTRVTDNRGNEYRLVLATDAAVAHGQLCRYKENLGVSGVLVTDVAGCVGQVFAGVAVLDKDPNTSAAQGEVFYIQTKGVAQARTSAASIVYGDLLMASASGTTTEVDPTASNISVLASGMVGKALEAGAGLGTTSTTKIFLF